MYTLETSVGRIVIRFRHVKDHRELVEIPPGVNLFRISRATICTMTTGNGTYFGQSFCSWLDFFDTEKGKIRAMKEALAKTGLSRAERANVWITFLAAKPDREHKKELVEVRA